MYVCCCCIALRVQFIWKLVANLIKQKLHLPTLVTRRLEVIFLRLKHKIHQKTHNSTAALQNTRIRKYTAKTEIKVLFQCAIFLDDTCNFWWHIAPFMNFFVKFGLQLLPRWTNAYAENVHCGQCCKRDNLHWKEKTELLKLLDIFLGWRESSYRNMNVWQGYEGNDGKE